MVRVSVLNVSSALWVRSSSVCASLIASWRPMSCVHALPFRSSTWLAMFLAMQSSNHAIFRSSIRAVLSKLLVAVLGTNSPLGYFGAPSRLF